VSRHPRVAGVVPQLYDNPACSKCRTARELLEEHHVEADTIAYLDEPPTVTELKELMRLLAIDDPRLMMRTGETVYTELDLAEREGDALLDAINRHPVLLERPIFVVEDRAVIARPPERLLELL
jgi:arsenate reductase (glutaredoxin)